MRIVESKKETKSALGKFQKRLKQESIRTEQLEWGFPGGERDFLTTYSLQTSQGVLQVGIPRSWGSRIPHLIRFEKDQGPPSPDVEINIPPELDRRISGVYIHADNQYWLASRGIFTAFRSRIPKSYTFSHFEKWQIEVEDADKLASVIPVCSIDSPSFSDDLATFAQAIIDLKAAFKSGNMSEAEKKPASSPWGDSDEFEGKKKATKSKPPIEYDYLHGPICNQLKKHLEGLFEKKRGISILKNKHVDVAIVNERSQKATHIFEVKTASLPSDQVYKAIGQLFYYKNLYGKKDCQLYLVLPPECRSEKTEQFSNSLEITVVYGNSEGFLSANKRSLENII